METTAKGPVCLLCATKSSTPQAAERATERIGVFRLLGSSEAVRQVRAMVKQYASVDAPVFITGETGTGKELIARALHEEGPRRRLPFVAFNCGAISDTLLQSELFGHKRGAFTGAMYSHDGFFIQAGNGTILLDEIGDTSPMIQVALLRVLETRVVRPVGADRDVPVQCRVLAASNANLEKLCHEGRFRRDLLYRLKQLEIYSPPLRERREDVEALALHFLRSERRHNDSAPGIAPELARKLEQHDWPGNIRELRHAVERMALLFPNCAAYGLAEYEGRPTQTARDVPPTRRTVVRVPVSFSGVTNGAGGSGIRSSVPVSREDVEQVIEQGVHRLRRLERIRNLFREHKILTRSELIRLLGISPNTATSDLQTLRDEAFLERVEPSASPRTHYFRLLEA
ncbi:MAG: sigma-54-dependent Fis family transcriptional regulator [Planctomycetota bacterium]|nr:sigma-54-dependent Fis family transcriptional regulator [Planctomycetota bacterium]